MSAEVRKWLSGKTFFFFFCNTPLLLNSLLRCLCWMALVFLMKFGVFAMGSIIPDCYTEQESKFFNFSVVKKSKNLLSCSTQNCCM